MTSATKQTIIGTAMAAAFWDCVSPTKPLAGLGPYSERRQ